MTSRGMARVSPPRTRSGTREAILQAARVLLRTRGPDGVGMRPVARAVGIPVSSLYRFYEDHAELMSSLRVQAYQELIAQITASRDEKADDAAIEQWLSIARGFRAWTLENPNEFSLLFTPPTHGVRIWTKEIEVERARALTVIGTVIEAAAADEGLEPTVTGNQFGLPHINWLGANGPLRPGIVQVTLGAWAALVGHLSLESRRSSVVVDGDGHYEDFLRGVLRGMGFRPRPVN